MNPISQTTSVSSRLHTINLGNNSPAAGPALTRKAVECLIHLVAAVALGIFGLISLFIGLSIMYDLGITAPIGVLLFSAGLIMLCIGLPERYRDVQKIWEKQQGSHSK